MDRPLWPRFVCLAKRADAPAATALARFLNAKSGKRYAVVRQVLSWPADLAALPAPASACTSWLHHHPAFDLTVPTRFYALIPAVHFESCALPPRSGAGYVVLADQIHLALHALNPPGGGAQSRGRSNRLENVRREIASASQ